MQQTLGKASDDILETPIRGGRSLTTTERRTIDLSGRIKGWGSDLDPKNRPGVPMDDAPGIGVEHLYPIFEQQVPKARVHKSTEHAKLTPVFGNVCPPRGLSGLIRNFAYNFSEGRHTHWLLLMTADRVDMIEELVLDVARLRIPNIPKEMGLTAELKYNRKGVLKFAAVAAIGAVGIGAAVIAAHRASSNSRSSRTSLLKAS